MKRKPAKSEPRKQPSLSPSTVVDGLEFDARRTQRLKTLELLRQGRTPLHVLEAAEHAATLAEQAIDTARQRRPPRPPLACQEGCAWCCHKRVGVSAAEVVRIAAYLRQSLSPEKQDEVRARVVQRDEERRGLSKDRWAVLRVPCPLLVEQRCSVYPVRPLTCRGYNSSDARRCELSVTKRLLVEVPIYEPQQRLATFVLDGTRAGLAEAGLDAGLLELTAALRIALETPQAVERWLAGAAVFTEARMA
jgi:Fe-S-cluster containining protein